MKPHFFQQQQQHMAVTMHPHQWAKKSKKTLWRHALGFLFWTQNFYLLTTSWVSLNLSIWNLQQPPLLCHPSSLTLHICMGHRQQLYTHLCTFSLWYATVCIVVYFDFAATISNYTIFIYSLVAGASLASPPSWISLRISLSCGCCSWSLVGMWTEPG